jgi:hypothetical protein
MDITRRNDWMITQSLERSLEVISAINRLSINAKLRVAGLSDTATDDEIKSARSVVQSFVSTLGALVTQARESEDRIAFGADPRLSNLARQFLSDRPQGPGFVAYSLDELKELEYLLSQGENADRRLLIDELAHFRSALEQHTQADAAIIFNEV